MGFSRDVGPPPPASFLMLEQTWLQQTVTTTFIRHFLSVGGYGASQAELQSSYIIFYFF